MNLICAGIMTIMIYLTPLTVTAYWDGDGMPPWGVTASGARTEWGIAAGPKEIPFGSELFVPGYGQVRIEDRGGDIRLERTSPNHSNIDLWYPDRESALAWGRRTVEVQTRGWRWPE